MIIEKRKVYDYAEGPKTTQSSNSSNSLALDAFILALRDLIYLI